VKTALVTGIYGFVGRHMARELAGRGYAVWGFDTNRSAANVADVRRIGMPHFPHIWPPGQVFDLVVHCAYRVGGRAAIDGVPMNLAHNLAADAALFDWAVRTKQRRVLYFSSSAAYPVRLQTQGHQDDVRRSSGPYLDLDFPARVATGMCLREDMINLSDVEQPDASYGWAKLSGEWMARAAAERGLPVHVVRPFSGYGGDQGEEYPFPALLRRVLASKGEPIEVWGSADQVRDWIHIDDVVNGALAVVDADERRPVNLCTGEPVNVGSLVERMWEIARPDASFPDVRVLAEKPMGVFYRVGDPARMHEHYEARVPLEWGIREAVEHLGGERWPR
jgi:nucleoside-diphosphate-sugar epimerase